MVALSIATTPLEDAMLHHIDVDEISDRVAIMRIQEDTTYRVKDYLAESTGIRKLASKPVDEDCRVKMCEWCYQVVDFCKFRRETVGIGMSYLDRYLCTPKGKEALCNRKEYQLAAMTALYIAIKIHEPLEMETSLLADLSRGCYTEMEFVHMEQTILQALKWRVNGPTLLGFVAHFVALLPESVHPAIAETIFDYARYQTEIAIAEHVLVSIKPSEVALAAVLNAIEGMDVALLPLKVQGKFVRNIERFSEIFIDDVEHIQSHLSLALASLLSGDVSEIIAAVTDIESEGEYVDDKSITAYNRRNSPVSVVQRNRQTSVV
jgi:hypothetical protein|uniref:Cyclin N-terminal domain-containing protein n=1 Tax=Phaeodactylum tricornutum TaxID=2850 RepID=A0A8J9WZT6_PHATR